MEKYTKHYQMVYENGRKNQMQVDVFNIEGF